MLKKLRIQLTLISTFITGTILFVMAVIVLLISEQPLKDRNYAYFKNNTNSIIYNIQNNKIISHLWLSQTEIINNLIIHIEDNSYPFIFNGSWHNSKTEREYLINKAKDIAAYNYKFDLYKSTNLSPIPKTIFFDFKGKYNEKYNASVSAIPSNSSDTYTLILIHDKQYETMQIVQNRILLFSLVVVGIISLLIFSWWFAGRNIKSIEKNEQKQIEFIAAASHELKAPLAVITTSASAISVQNDNQQSKFINNIQKECKRMARLIDDLLLLSNSDAKTWTIKKEKVEIDTILLDIIDFFSSIAIKNNQSLTLTLPENAVPFIYGDCERLIQAISVFIDNALNYTRSGGKIKIVLSLELHFIVIQIIDNGIGISNEDKKHIFDRFYRSDKSHSTKGHYGLGLSIAYEIIRLHNGSIYVSDTHGGGATFTIKLNKNLNKY